MTRHRPFDTRNFVRICLFAAIIAALGLLPKFDIPFVPGVPVTAQTLGVMLAGAVLGPRNGALAVALFVFVVLLGLPLLAGGRGGLGVLVGPTGGFLLGWIPGALVTGLVVRLLRFGGRFTTVFTAALLGGICVVYAIGIPWLAAAAALPLKSAALATLIFLPGDILKAVLAAAIVASMPHDKFDSV